MKLKKKITQGKTAQRIQTTRPSTPMPEDESKRQAAEFRAMVARAAIIGMKKGSRVHNLFQEVNERGA